MDTLGLIYYKKDLLDDSLRVFNDIVVRGSREPDLPPASGHGPVQEGRPCPSQERTGYRQP